MVTRLMITTAPATSRAETSFTGSGKENRPDGAARRSPAGPSRVSRLVARAIRSPRRAGRIPDHSSRVSCPPRSPRHPAPAPRASGGWGGESAQAGEELEQGRVHLGGALLLGPVARFRDHEGAPQVGHPLVHGGYGEHGDDGVALARDE